MHLICSYCGRYIKEKKPYEVTRSTHGICMECYAPLIKQIQGLSYDEYLETFEEPVMIVDSRQKIVAANGAALSMMEKSMDRVLGMSGGDALECLHSRLAKGCGKIIYCETCRIRNLVLKTIRQRISEHNIFVSLKTTRGKSDFWITTHFFDGLVQIVFEAHQLNAGLMRCDASKMVQTEDENGTYIDSE